MQSLSHYQLSPANQLPMLSNQNAATLSRLSTQSHQMSNGFLSPAGQPNHLAHGTIRPHNQAGHMNGGLFNRGGLTVNGGLTPLQNSIISNYATISRAAHYNQLNGGPGSLLTTQVPNSQLALNTQAIYQQLTPLNAQINHLSQFQLANGPLYGAPQFGIEVGLDLNRNDRSCCCCFNRRCNISRVIAFICGLVVLFLMSLTISTSNWLTADKYRQGLFQFCVEEGAEMPLPFGLNVQPGCYPGRDTDYIRIAAGLCCFGFIFDLLATLMTGFGLCSTNSYKKYSLYKFALYIMIVSLILILSALVIYPAFFASEIETSNRQVWEFGWSYGVGWGACIFLIGAILLLLCDRESNDIYYRERTIIHNPGGSVREVKA